MGNGDGQGQRNGKGNANGKWKWTEKEQGKTIEKENGIYTEIEKYTHTYACERNDHGTDTWKQKYIYIYTCKQIETEKWTDKSEEPYYNNDAENE